MAQAVVFLFNLVLLCWILVGIKGTPATQRFVRLASFTVVCLLLFINTVTFFYFGDFKAFPEGFIVARRPVNSKHYRL